MQDRIGHLHLHTAYAINTLAAIQHVYSTQQNRIRHRSARYAAALPMTANGANSCCCSCRTSAKYACMASRSSIANTRTSAPRGSCALRGACVGGPCRRNSASSISECVHGSAEHKDFAAQTVSSARLVPPRAQRGSAVGNCLTASKRGTMASNET